jgi:pantoate--beta-alanine ligase
LEYFEDIPPLHDYIARHKREGKRVVLVPTMGALHDGHKACIRDGRSVDNGVLVVSIYVNPAQFGPGEDMDRYPRTLDADLSLCGEWEVDAVFAPDDRTVYPAKQRVWVTVEELSAPLCGRSRRHHFRGVTTVVAKLFNIVQPDVAVFGQKDAQQAIVIREMVDQLNMSVDLKVAPTAREPDGLARSSRNVYLREEERVRAPSIYRALCGALERIRGGQRDSAELIASVERKILDGGIVDVEYVEVLDVKHLSPLATVSGKVILAAAARVGSTRLIDNVVFRVDDDGSVVEETLF